MNFKTEIKKIAEERLHQFGFVCEKSKLHLVISFSRDLEDVQEIITFDQSEIYENSIRVHFSTSKNRRGIDGAQLIGDRSGFEWWYFSDQEHLRATVKELVELSIRLGLHWFEYERDPLIHPENDDSERLYMEYEQFAQWFANEYNLTGSDPSIINSIETIVLRNKINSQQETGTVF